MFGEGFDFVALALDLVMVISVLIPLIIGLKSGLIKTVFRFCKMIIAVILAFCFCKPLGLFLKERFVHTFVYGKVSETIHSCLADAGLGEVSGESLSGSVPEGLKDFLNIFGMNTDEMAETAVQSGSEAVEQMITSVSDAVSSAASVVLAFIAIFIVGLIAAVIVGKILNAIVTHLPVLGTLNTVLGGVIGLLIGLIVAWVVAQGVVALLGVIGGIDYQNARLLQFFHSGSPFRWILQMIIQNFLAAAQPIA
ncbi:MAG: CvpA family protein [Clostridia bacterium]|nr:CvpA family protein [Clostridia bacterium]